MPDAKSRARVERLLKCDFRPDDLTGLFLYARDHCDGRQSVRDIGDFVAHHNERDKGIVTESTRAWFASARFHASTFGPDGKQAIDATKMPAATPEYFKIAVDRIDPKLITEKTGLRATRARQILLGVTGRLAENNDGSWALATDLDETEKKVVECVCSVLVAKPAFSADRLCDDFFATLKSNGLITRDELRMHRDQLETLVKLYAVAAMHNCVVQIGDGSTVQLKARPEVTSKEIQVNAAVPAPGRPGLFWSASIYTAESDPGMHCHPDLLKSDWDFEIELAPDRRLCSLRPSDL
jgi:hypothetical protein